VPPGGTRADDREAARHLLAGLELAVREVNDAGGVVGRPLELVIRDTAADPQRAAAAVNELARRGVAALAGEYHSVVARTAAAKADALGLPFLCSSAVLDTLTEQPTEWVARLAPAQSHGWQIYADFLLGAGHSRIAVATEPSVHGGRGRRVLPVRSAGPGGPAAAAAAASASTAGPPPGPCPCPAPPRRQSVPPGGRPASPPLPAGLDGPVAAPMPGAFLPRRHRDHPDRRALPGLLRGHAGLPAGQLRADRLGQHPPSAIATATTTTPRLNAGTSPAAPAGWVGRVKLPVIFRSCSWLAVCGDGRFWPDAAKEHA
jgi:substrate-binding family protein